MKAIFSPMHQQEAWQSRFIQWDQVLTLTSFLLLHPALQPWAVCTPGCHAVSLWGAWRHFASVEKVKSLGDCRVSILVLLCELLPWLSGTWGRGLGVIHLWASWSCTVSGSKKMLRNLLELSRDRYLSSGMFDRSNKSSSSANSWFYYVDFMTT